MLRATGPRWGNGNWTGLKRFICFQSPQLILEITTAYRLVNSYFLVDKRLICRAMSNCVSCDSVFVKIFFKIIIIIIITLFESQIILAEHECCTNWGDCKSNKSNQIKCWFLRRGENRSSRRKTSRSRVENQQTQPTYDAGSGNRTRDTLVEGERSHHYTNPAV